LAEILKVSSTSDPSATAGALANTIREEGVAELQAIGPKAVNQAVKAITIARGYMAPSGVDLVFLPSFVDVEIDHENKTAMRLEVKTRLPFKPEKATSNQNEEKDNNGVNKEADPEGSKTNQDNQEEENGGEGILDI
jgi:stage V sporulation protein S